ncbi:MAG: hypothetical protein ACRDPK_09955 [Carbonactinosporaceae bacterium]
MSADDRLDLEFAYTSYAGSCRDLYSPSLCCRRPAGHDGEHAAGFGHRRVRWADVTGQGGGPASGA